MRELQGKTIGKHRMQLLLDKLSTRNQKLFIGLHQLEKIIEVRSTLQLQELLCVNGKKLLFWLKVT